MKSNYRFLILLSVIIFLIFVLHFANYQNRWGLAYDQARDVIVSKVALQEHALPLIGPFSSAGQFVYGPQWFWIIAAMILIYPYSIMTPWIIQSLIFILMIFVMVEIGNELLGKKFGWLVGFLTAISPAQIQQSVNLTSPSMVSVFSILSAYFFVKFLKTKNATHIFWMSFCVGTAINIHFQATGLIILFPVALFFGRASKDIIKFFLLGFFLPFIPLLLFDLQNNFFELRNIIDYFLHGQYNIYIAKRWLTYAGVFWPSQWSNIIGGNIFVGYGIIISTVLFFLYDFLKKKIDRALFGVFLSFILMVIVLRYYRGELFDSYIVSLHAFVLIVSSWVIYSLYKRARLAGIIFLFIVSAFSIWKTWGEIAHAENFTNFVTQHWIDQILASYPDKKFAVYDFHYARRDKTLPLVLFLDSKRKIGDNGMKIGLTIQTNKIPLPHPVILGEKGGYQFFDLSSSTSAQLSQEGWAFVNPSAVYHSVEEWYKK